MTDAAKLATRARTIQNEAAEVLADRKTPKDARTAATVAESMADSVLSMLRNGEHVTAAFCLGEAAGAIETARRWRQFARLWPDAKHGREFPAGDTAAATEAHKAKAEARREQLLRLARALLSDGHGRLKNERINVRALANECVKKGRNFCPVGRDSAEGIIREAVKAGKL